jgi:hypothetical protein
MKEIDFLPEWYKTGRQRHISYRTQYVAIFGILILMIFWSALTGHSIRSARAQLSQMKRMQMTNLSPLLEYNKLKGRLQRLSDEAEILDVVDSRIIVSNVLAELAFLIDERIVLSEMDIGAEAFESGAQVGNISGSAVAAVKEAFDKQRLPLEGDVRFRILMTGIAVNAADVARLIRTLEDSPYVRDVKPMFCRNKRLKDYQATEFQVSCYIANYREEN